MNNQLHIKHERLRAELRSLESALVAYSGGVDSALVMAVAHQELGERSLACIGVSPSYPTREMRAAIRLAETMGVPYRLIDTQEYPDNHLFPPEVAQRRPMAKALVTKRFRRAIAG